jgi:hypothetical protein
VNSILASLYSSLIYSHSDSLLKTVCTVFAFCQMLEGTRARPYESSRIRRSDPYTFDIIKMVVLPTLMN